MSDCHYKAYFQNLLSFNSAAKETNLRCAGWSQDTSWIVEETFRKDAQNPSVVYHTYPTSEPGLQNEGFMARVHWFKNRYSEIMDVPYRTSGYTFIGPLMSDFHGITKPLMPRTRFHIQLNRAPDKFAIVVANRDKSLNDKHQYQVYIEQCNLYVKIAHMSMPLMKEVELRHKKEPLKYFFRGLQIRVCFSCCCICAYMLA